MKKFFVFIFLSSQLLAATDPQDFGKALEYYLKGDWPGAHNLTKKLFKENPADEKVRDLHHKALVKIAEYHEKNGKYAEALDAVNEALSIKRTRELENMKARLEQKLKKIEKPKPAKKVSAPKAEVKKVEEKKIETKSPEPEKEEVKKIKSGETVVEFPGTLFVLSFLNLLGLVFLSYFVARAVSKKKEERLLEEERRISQIISSLGSKAEFQTIIQNQKEILNELAKIPAATEMLNLQNAEILKLMERLTRGAGASNVEFAPFAERAGIASVDEKARIRADSVEVIEQIFKDSPIFEDMLEPYINDPNNRVKANACKALFSKNRRRALEILKEMAQSDDMWMRLSAAWVCGEVSASECVKILSPLLNDSSFHVRKRAYLSFEKMKKSGISLQPEVEESLLKLRAEISEAPEKSDNSE